VVECAFTWTPSVPVPLRRWTTRSTTSSNEGYRHVQLQVAGEDAARRDEML
jgi:hypothetical protein